MTTTSVRLAVVVLGALLMVGAAPSSTPLEKALQSQRQLVAENPTSASAYNDLGNLLTVQGDLDAAEAAYRQSLSLDPTLVSTRYNLGLLLAQRGDRAEALADLRQVVEASPGNAWAWFQVGFLEEQRGKRALALAAYEKAFALDPSLTFSDVNPQIIDSSLVTRALLQTPLAGAVATVPRTYEDPARISQLLLGPATELLERPSGGESSEGTPPETSGEPGPPKVPTGEGAEGEPETSEGTATTGEPRTIRSGDLGEGSSVGQAEPPSSGYSRERSTGSRYIPGGAVTGPGYLTPSGGPAGSRSRRGGFVPDDRSTGQLDIRLLPHSRRDGPTVG